MNSFRSKTTTSLKNRPLAVRRGFLLMMLALASFALSTAVRAQLPSPPPDGGYPNANTAEGDSALFSVTTGSGNTAIGFNALNSNTTGNNNTADGGSALGNNTTGSDNTASDVNALGGTITITFNTGSDNTATGENALQGNTIGNNNTANGLGALNNNTTGSSNIALGFNAGGNLTTGNNNIDIGNVGSASESNNIRIGTVGTHTNTFIAGIHGVAVTGTAVVVSSSGQLGVAPSSERFKNQIKPMDKASEAILALKPVTFRYKHELDPAGIPQFGLVAEQVEKVNPDLVARDSDGKVSTVRYEAVNAMLLNEFLKEHRTVQDLKKEVAALTAIVKEQAGQIQKVNEQLEVRKAAPHLVADNQ
jgi:hypothetical protein